MTKEEGALIIAYCDENKIRNKQRLSELGVNPWSCYDAESNYTPKQEKWGGSETITTIVNTSDGKTLPVPNYYWKVLLKVERDGSGNVTDACTIGFWFEHKEYSTSSYANYAVSVNDIESWTGLDLFANLPDSIEETVEANSNWQSFQNF